jgi:heme A synthase
MPMVMAIAIAVLAVCAGTLLAVYELPRAEDDRRIRRLSLALVIATAVTAAAGAAYAIGSWILA